MSKADLHIHTFYSWDAMMTPAGALKAAAQAGLNVIAITDHDEMRGSLEARQLAGKYNLEVVPGLEISTADGHLLALYLERPVPARLPLIETLLRIGAQGGLAIAPHPSAMLSHSLSRPAIRAALADPGAGKVLIGIEVFNGGLPYRRNNLSARKFGDTLPLAQVGNSDAHIFWTVGIGMTEFPGRSAEDLRRALLERTTRALTRPGVLAVKPILGWPGHYLMKRAGWVISNAQPHLPLRFARMP
jgi:predicted metal-dependent phosphoesterase TrpH